MYNQNRNTTRIVYRRIYFGHNFDLCNFSSVVGRDFSQLEVFHVVGLSAKNKIYQKKIIPSSGRSVIAIVLKELLKCINLRNTNRRGVRWFSSGRGRLVFGSPRHGRRRRRVWRSVFDPRRTKRGPLRSVAGHLTRRASAHTHTRS